MQTNLHSPFTIYWWNEWEPCQYDQQCMKQAPLVQSSMCVHVLRQAEDQVRYAACLYCRGGCGALEHHTIYLDFFFFFFRPEFTHLEGRSPISMEDGKYSTCIPLDDWTHGTQCMANNVNNVNVNWRLLPTATITITYTVTIWISCFPSFFFFFFFFKTGKVGL